MWWISILCPIFGTYVYLKMSHFLKLRFVENRSVQTSQFDAPVKYFSMVHNTALAGFSLYTCASLCERVYANGFVVQSGYYMSDPGIKRLIFWFYVSKYYEYFDTFLLYMKGRNPIFLQKYHHIGAVFFWHLCYVYDIDAIVLGSVFNSGVHTIMYSYYLTTLFNIQTRGLRQYITSLQIAQLTIGLWWSSYQYYPPVETDWNYGIIVLFDMYIVGLILMFGKFAADNYSVDFAKQNRQVKCAS